MEKTRVNKGEKYWFIDSNLRVRYIINTNLFVDKDFFTIGNYFHTKKEAEEMVEKIRKVLNGAWVLTPPEGEIFSRKVEAVLNGADVIVMPSEEEIKSKSNELRIDEIEFLEETFGTEPITVRNTSSAWEESMEDLVKWLKSKIVK